VTPEGRTKKLLKAYLAGFATYQFWAVQTGYGAVTVDCIACWDGEFLAFECKREGIEKPTPRQAAIMAQMRKAGARTFLVTMREGKLKWINLR
jgi:penicillin-binding protein-related factor A (putative recombinase)